MTTPTPGGATTPVWFKFEDGFGNAPDTFDETPKVWGHGATVDTASVSRDGRRITLPASNITVTVEPGQYSGAVSVTFGLSDPWYLRGIFGAPTRDDNNGTWTYSGVDPKSKRIYVGYESEGDIREFRGCIPATHNVQPTVGEERAQCTIEYLVKEEELDEDATFPEQPTPDFEPLNYGHAQLDINETEQLIMQDATWSMNPNTEMDYGWGSQFPVGFFHGLFQIDLDFTAYKVGTTRLKSAYGGSASMSEDVADTDTVTMDLMRNGAGMTFNGSGSFANEFDESGIGDPSSRLSEQISRIISDVEVVATNETAEEPL